MSVEEMEVAVLGGGCFWCVEAVFLEIKGIEAVTSGYSGGHIANPTYYQVCSEKNRACRGGEAGIRPQLGHIC